MRVQVNEGYPMAAPTSTVLQGSKRATRYWPLYTQLQAAVTPALHSHPQGLPAAAKDPLNDINSLPGKNVLSTSCDSMTSKYDLFCSYACCLVHCNQMVPAFACRHHSLAVITKTLSLQTNHA